MGSTTRADVEAARLGDGEAFTRLVEAHAPGVSAVTTAVMRGDGAGDEVAHDVFVQAWAGLGRLEDPDRFGAWVRQIARNRAREALRTRERRREESVTDTLPDPSPGPEVSLDEARREAALWRALDALDAPHREVLELYYRDGRRVEEVARLLDLPEATVRKRLSRARDRLRDEVRERLGERRSAAAVLVGLLPRAARAAWRPSLVALAVAAGVLTVGALAAWSEVRGGLPPIPPPVATVPRDRWVEPVATPPASAASRSLVVEAFLAAEDVRFYEHGALDAWATARAATHLLAGGPREGGSTLTQQLAKRMLIEAMPEPTLRRKLSEAVLAFELERTLGKDEILARYLDGVQLGAGTSGIDEAAWTTFGVAPEQLTAGQAALLAGLAARPADHPFRNPGAARARRDEVLSRMERAGFLEPDEAAEARSERVP